jgi:uncharacterized protein (TIGR00106 family)
MAIMEISCVPIGTANTSISSFVAECVRIVERQGFTYELTAMGTQVEGEVDALLQLAARMHRALFAHGAQRVLTTIRIDERADKVVLLAGKKQAVLKQLRERPAER